MTHNDEIILLWLRDLLVQYLVDSEMETQSDPIDCSVR